MVTGGKILPIVSDTVNEGLSYLKPNNKYLIRNVGRWFGKKKKEKKRGGERREGGGRKKEMLVESILNLTHHEA